MAAAGAISAPVAALTQGVLKTMLLTRLKIATALLLMLGILGVGSAGLVYRARAADDANKNRAEAGTPGAAANDQEKGDTQLARLKAQLERLRGEIDVLDKQVRQMEAERAQKQPAKGALEKLVAKVYPVAGLVNPVRQEGTEPLVEVITTTVRPRSWDVMGGEGAVRYFPEGSSLVIRQSDEVHREVQTLLNALREAKAEQEKRALQGVP
jgi:hypothetical protein